MTTLEELTAKLEKLEAKTAEVESENTKLKASISDNEKDQKDGVAKRIASIKKAVKGMTDSEGADYLSKAKTAEEDKDIITAIENLEKGLKKEGKTAEDEKDKEIDGLKAKLAIPLIAKLVDARRSNGQSEEQLALFAKEISLKSLEDIESQVQSESYVLDTIKSTTTYVPVPQPLLAKESTTIEIDSEIGVAL